MEDIFKISKHIQNRVQIEVQRPLSVSVLNQRVTFNILDEDCLPIVNVTCGMSEVNVDTVVGRLMELYGEVLYDSAN